MDAVEKGKGGRIRTTRKIHMDERTDRIDG